ncbi:MAG: iron-containing alcohol dehydrogenase [Xenococcaceae cyanobacterium MO_167.B27]|nr:iron-containing alcohol dehydrogenase [Xenococcaceae cyanobacterium MO_167.B27]
MTISPFFFAKVPPIHFGTGKIEQLPSLLKSVKAHKVLVVTGGKSLEDSGNWSVIQSLLEQNQISFERIAYSGEPSTPDVDRLCQQYRPQQIEAVVGIGGGSVIDLGKAISAMLPHQNSIFDHLERVGKGIPHSGVKLPYLAIPTTSGTGGEVTKNAVISEVGTQGYKKSLRHDNLIPDGIIIDGNLLTSCPQSLTVACGLDTLTQLLEPFLSPTASPLTDALALSGIEKVAQYFLAACGSEGKNPQVREEIAYASLCSGICLANAGLGIVHGLASPLGGLFPIPHGVVCGTLMGIGNKVTLEAMRAREPENPALVKMSQVGRIFSRELGKSEQYYADFLIKTLFEWIEQLEVPKLSDYGVTASDLETIVEQTSNRNNPIQLSREEIFTILSSRL